jgi:hypothetical protein
MIVYKKREEDDKFMSWDYLLWKCHRRVSSGVLSTIQLIIARATVFSKNKMNGYD